MFVEGGSDEGSGSKIEVHRLVRVGIANVFIIIVLIHRMFLINFYM